MQTKTHSPELLHRMDAYWRAANYLSVGQIYLYDNPLLRRPLTLADVKHMLLGHLGHDVRPELHLRAPEPDHQEIRPGYAGNPGLEMAL
jgi:phosphoketolase